jgi:hypothetical protein
MLRFLSKLLPARNLKFLSGSETYPQKFVKRYIVISYNLYMASHSFYPLLIAVSG